MEITPQTERMLRQIIRDEIKRLREDIAKLKQELFKARKKEQWVTASIITELTGWTFKDMAKHRKQGTIDFKYLKQGEDGKKSTIRYNMYSIPEYYLKK